MREKIYNFFLNKSVFLIFAIFSNLMWLAWGISLIATGGLAKLIVFAGIFFALTFAMTIAYVKGETNLQKMFFGSLLIFLVVDYVELVDLFISLNNPAFIAMNSVILGLLIIFYICHMLQQLDHVGKNIIMVINQVCGLAIVCCVIYLGVCVANETATATDFTFKLAVMFTLFLIICMETRISRYKQMRTEYKERGIWTDEMRAEAKKIFKF